MAAFVVFINLGSIGASRENLHWPYFIVGTFQFSCHERVPVWIIPSTIYTIRHALLVSLK